AWASLPHLPRYYAPLRLPPPRLGGFARRSPSRYLACFHAFVVSLTGSCPGGSATDHARAFGHPVPYSGSATTRQVALPTSPLTPLDPCPALRPRWGPAHSPYRTQDCCLPVRGNRRRSSPCHWERYPAVHDATLFGALSRGLRPRYPRL